MSDHTPEHSSAQASTGQHIPTFPSRTATLPYMKVGTPLPAMPNSSCRRLRLPGHFIVKPSSHTVGHEGLRSFPAMPNASLSSFRDFQITSLSSRAATLPLMKGGRPRPAMPNSSCRRLRLPDHFIFEPSSHAILGQIKSPQKSTLVRKHLKIGIRSCDSLFKKINFSFFEGRVRMVELFSIMPTF